MRDPNKWQLKEWAQNEAYDFRANYYDGNCSCHLGDAPCSSCTHPGNPLNLEETDDAWETIEVDHKAELKKFLYGK